MKKKKIIILGAIASLSVCALASCGGTDYKSKNFTVETPTKDSKATIEYKTNEELKELDSKILSHHFGNGATAEDSTKKEELKKNSLRNITPLWIMEIFMMKQQSEDMIINLFIAYLAMKRLVQYIIMKTTIIW